MVPGDRAQSIHLRLDLAHLPRRSLPSASARAWLTEFYLWISFGGALGGIFAGLIAPNIFNNVYEYSILIAIAVLVLPTMSDGGWRQFTRNGGPSLTAATILAIVGVINDLSPLIGLNRSRPSFYILLIVVAAAVLFQARRAVPYFGVIVLVLLSTRLWHPGEHVIYTARSFFGVHRVVETEDRTHHVLLHGTTMHGIMRVRDARRQSRRRTTGAARLFLFRRPDLGCGPGDPGRLGRARQGRGGRPRRRQPRLPQPRRRTMDVLRDRSRRASDRERSKLFRYLSECAPTARSCSATLA